MTTTIKNKQVHVFALGNTKKLLNHLKNIYCYNCSSPNKLLDIILQNQPLYLLGLGSYSGIGQNKIHIETVCSNHFNNIFIQSNHYEELEIKPFLNPTPIMNYSKTIGYSYCNRISWKIMQLINQNSLKSFYTFLHIPRTLDPWIASQEINAALMSFNDSSIK
jgi:pyrrolidone-carboxylate peptidase